MTQTAQDEAAVAALPQAVRDLVARGGQVVAMQDQVRRVGGCEQPIRMHGRVDLLDTITGEVREALRHWYASVLLDSGESIKAVSEYLGHADPGFTLRTYTHLMPSSEHRTRAAMNRALGYDGPDTAQDAAEAR